MGSMLATPARLPLEGQVLSGIAAVAFLAIALLAISRRARSRLARQLGMMSVVVFAYNILEVAYSATGHLHWVWLEYAAASFLSIPTLHVFFGFVGQARQQRGTLLLFSAYFGLLTAACALAFVVPPLSGFPGGGLWAIVMLVGVIPSFGTAAYYIGRHVRLSEGDERARARLFVAALLLGVGSMITDLFAVAGLAVPRLSLLGLVVSGGVIAAIVLELRMLERVTALTVVNAGVVSLLAVVALAVLFAWAHSELAFFVAGTMLVCLALVAALRPILHDLSEQRSRNRYLATLGRFSEQMAHDVRNPLAAIRGAAQFLREELNQGRSIDEQEEFLDIIVERCDRLERVVRDYQRMGRVDLSLKPVDVNAILDKVMNDQRRALADGTAVELELAEGLPPVQGDGDLLTNAFENLVRNAFEALAEAATEKGRIHASTELSPHERGDRVRVTLRDNGPGMDVRTKERALDDFYTTKAQGSGLGLPFVVRIVEAHGGSLVLDSMPGRGTTVRIELPTGAQAERG